MNKYFMIMALAAMTIGFCSCGGKKEADNLEEDDAYLYEDAYKESTVEMAYNAVQYMIEAAQTENVGDYAISMTDLVAAVDSTSNAEDLANIVSVLDTLAANEANAKFKSSLSATDKANIDAAAAKLDAAIKKAKAKVGK